MNNQVTPVSTQYAYPLEVSRGNVPGAEPFGSYGKRTATGAVTEQMLWPNGAFLLPPAAGPEMTAVSTSTADSSAGTGIRTIQIHYLDPLLGVAVPAGKRLMVSSMYASSVSPGSSECTVALASTHFDGHDFTADGIFLPIASAGFQDAGMVMHLNPPIPFSEGACVGMPYTQSSTATVSGGWFGWVENA